MDGTPSGSGCRTGIPQYGLGSPRDWGEGLGPLGTGMGSPSVGLGPPEDQDLGLGIPWDRGVGLGVPWDRDLGPQAVGL